MTANELNQQIIKCTLNKEQIWNLMLIICTWNFSTKRKDEDKYIESRWIWEETSGHGGTLTE